MAQHTPHDGGPVLDATHLCATCGTDTREGEHRVITASNNNGVTFSCRFPLESALPRTVQYLRLADEKAEYWYRMPCVARAQPEALSPREVQDRHIATWGQK